MARLQLLRVLWDFLAGMETFEVFLLQLEFLLVQAVVFVFRLLKSMKRCLLERKGKVLVRLFSYVSHQECNQMYEHSESPTRLSDAFLEVRVVGC